MDRDSQTALIPYEFVIATRTDAPPEVLAVLCRSEDEAVAAAKMFAEDTASVELWQGERCVWSSAHQVAREG